MQLSLRPKNKKAVRTFFYALLTATVIFLPFVIYDKGYFIYFGDFNVQQIPFYQLAHEAIRTGDVGWNWYTDLGVNFIGSYSFYLLFSPFFWMTLPFPTAFLPHLMAPLLVLKTACAALTAHLYLRRFVWNEDYATIGALLYAFSGWMSFNVFFNHFHEVAVFFPLLLLGVELLVVENRKGVLAVAVAVNAMVNYWFFAGSAVFVVIYVFLRMTDKSWGLSLRKFLYIAAEALIGVAISAVVLLPSVMALMGNPRTGSDELLTGWSMWLYWHEERPPAIIQSLFFPPEVQARPNFLPNHGAKWASLSGWLPLFSMTGVLAYFFRRKNDWLRKLLALCLVFSQVPALNSLFILLNDSYYARWFYMPVLLMALATVRALEDSAPQHGLHSTDDFARGVKWTGVVVAVFTVMCGLTPTYDEDGFLVFGLADNLEQMWVYCAIAAVFLALTAVLVLHFRKHPRFYAFALAGVMVASAGFGVYYISLGKSTWSRDRWVIEYAIGGREKISLPEDDTFSRVDVYDGSDNVAMYWHLPTIQAFHSIVPPSIMEFYPQVGVTRDVGSRPEADYYALRPLLSVRWLFIEESKREQEPMPGYVYHDTQNGFNVYENLNYIPFGFAYDEYVTPRQMEDVTRENRSNLMLRAVVLEEDAVERTWGYVYPMTDDGYMDFTEEAMEYDVDQRRLYTADTVDIDTTGFTATTSFDEPKLLFFSVPWEGGWSASFRSGDSSGELQIEKANLGFMAVRVPAGEVTVRFDYKTPGLFTGAIVTVGGLMVLAGYLLLRSKERQPKVVPNVGQALLEGHTVELTIEEYQEIYSDKEARQTHMQEVLNEAAARHSKTVDELPEEEKTLRFEPNGPAAPPLTPDELDDVLSGPLDSPLDPLAGDPLLDDPLLGPDPLGLDPLLDDPLLSPDPLGLDDPLAADPLLDDPLLGGLSPAVYDPLLDDPLLSGDLPAGYDPLIDDVLTGDPLLDDPLAIDPLGVDFGERHTDNPIRFGNNNDVFPDLDDLP